MKNGYVYGNPVNPVNTIDPIGEYVAGYEEERYVENPITGKGRMTGNKKYPLHNGRYNRGKQIFIDGAAVVGYNRLYLRSRNTRFLRTKRVAFNKLKSSVDWNYKLRKDLEGLELDVYNEIYKNDAAKSPRSILGNMMVGAAGNELGFDLELTKQIDGVYQYFGTSKTTATCFISVDGFKNCDADDLIEVEAGYHLGEVDIIKGLRKDQ
ncbi:hypothetical protein IC620_13690 [Hazenella sp. IB182357]|uniref:Uncharacterized protein n=1 Tax=Polycladospora coralii TaxID=2771432 RepID=A0A926NBA1_9BACL|nr:hypothetical protein [Polycladospora coralii]MBD1373402.1 hypothetical protein [Polycladospora coralii]